MKQKSQTPQEQIQSIDIALINADSSNYRGNNGTDQKDESLQELSQSILQHGILQPILLRANDNSYQIVCGMRRYKAALLAKIKNIPAIVKTLSDDQVLQIQIIENLQRENPHPLMEAKAFLSLLNLRSAKHTQASIAAAVGKSQTYIQKRLKLNDLTEQWQEIFIQNKINTAEALKLSALHISAQSTLYENNAQDWQDDHWYFEDIDWAINQVLMTLDDAPFDINDKKLIKAAGACTSCPFNTAVLTSLFPDSDSTARCTNEKCFKDKSIASASSAIAKLLKQETECPIAFDSDADQEAILMANDKLFHGKSILNETADFNWIKIQPEQPLKEHFDDYDEDEENEQEYQEALLEWKDDMIKWANLSSEKEFKKVIYINHQNKPYLAFITLKASNNTNQQSFSKQTAASFKEAVKNNEITPDLINNEKARLLEREKRAKELDEEKLHFAIYEELKLFKDTSEAPLEYGLHDKTIISVILYEQLGYSEKNSFSKQHFKKDSYKVKQEQVFQFFATADDSITVKLLKSFICSQNGAQFPNSLMGFLLRKLAEGTTGFDLESIFEKQKQSTHQRLQKLKEKIVALDKKAATINIPVDAK